MGIDGRKKGTATYGSANMLFSMTPPAGQLGWNTPVRSNSPRRGQPEVNPHVSTKFAKSNSRRTWNAQELETLLQDKIRMKTAGKNGRAFQAIKLFERDGADIFPDAWKRGLKTLLGMELTEEEVMGLFNKYDG